jgi:predicted homoserine dehydrogenase-like protein
LTRPGGLNRSADVYHEKLVQFERQGGKIRVALVGAGAMGVGIAWQIGRTPAMELVSITDVRLEAALKAARAYGKPYAVVGPGDRLPRNGEVLVARDPFFLLERREEAPMNVLVEATNSIGFAGRLSLEALRKGIHVVLMNAEVDLALGPFLHRTAADAGVVVTSDAGDQHGVLMRMIDEARLWSFGIAMAGNIKGFLDRYATASGLEHEARIRNLDPVQCCAYTDGTKLNIEMALVANGAGLAPSVPGMTGPRAKDVREVLGLFDFGAYSGTGTVDYILGAEPGGGVFLVGHCEDALQASYLSYYKLGNGPFYLLYRPYHLCHLETPWAIARAVLDGAPLLWPRHGRATDVYAYAKRDVDAGETVPHGIGGDAFYGLVERAAPADGAGKVPIALLEAEGGRLPRMKRRVRKDAPLGADDVELPETFLLDAFRRQEAMTRATSPLR